MTVAHIRTRQRKGEVVEMTKSWLQTNVIFVVTDALGNVLEDEVLILHCHVNGDCGDAHTSDPSCPNQLMVANQNAHAFRPNSMIAPRPSVP